MPGSRTAVEILLATLDLEPLEVNLFRGMSPQVGWQRVFRRTGDRTGASPPSARSRRTATCTRCTAISCGPAIPAVPIIYEVDRLREGGSFTTRNVVAVQHGKAIFSLLASFQRWKAGWSTRWRCPRARAGGFAERKATRRAVYRPRARKRAPILGSATGRSNAAARPQALRFAREARAAPEHLVPRHRPLPKDPAVQASVLAYASDMTLLDTSLFAHGNSVFDPKLQVASLDHSIWFHRPVDMEQWHLYTQDSPSSAGGRGLNRGMIFSRDGVLVASVAQEGLIRLRPPAAS